MAPINAIPPTTPPTMPPIAPPERPLSEFSAGGGELVGDWDCALLEAAVGLADGLEDAPAVVEVNVWSAASSMVYEAADGRAEKSEL
jgi:hypothetical protein